MDREDPERLSEMATDDAESQACREIVAQYWKAKARRYEEVHDRSPDGALVFRPVRNREGEVVDLECLHCNPSAIQITGRNAGDLLGQRLVVEMAGSRREGLFDTYVRAMGLGEPHSHEFSLRREGLDYGFRIASIKLMDGFDVAFSDLIVRKRTEEEVIPLATGVRHVTRDLRLVIEELRVVAGGSLSGPLKDLEGVAVGQRGRAERIKRIAQWLMTFSAPTRSAAPVIEGQGGVASLRAGPSTRSETAPSWWRTMATHPSSWPIPPAALGRLFEPFSMTKPPFVGIGLGLSICHNLVTGMWRRDLGPKQRRLRSDLSRGATRGHVSGRARRTHPLHRSLGDPAGLKRK